MTNFIPLININRMNDIFPNNYSISNDISNQITNIKYTFIRYADTFILDAFIIPTSINLSDIIDFEIFFGNNIIWKIPFDIIKANSTKIISDNYYIKIDNTLFIHKNDDASIIKNYYEFPLLQFHIIDIRLNSKQNFRFQLITKNVFYQINIKNNFLYNNLELKTDIYQYQYFPIIGSSNIINPHLVSIGIYIKTDQPIIEYKLLLNNMIYIKLSKYLIEFYNNLIYKKKSWSKKHSLTLEYTLNKIFPLELIHMIEKYIEQKYEYLYYFPFGEFIDCTVNFSKLDNVKIELLTENNMYNGSIIVKNINRLNIKNGIHNLSLMN